MTRKLMMPFAKAVIFTLFTALILTSCDDKNAFTPEDKLIPTSELPVTSRSYVETYFPNIAISQAWEDKNALRPSYEVYLVNGVRLEFDKGGKVIEIESRDGLPAAVIPTEIQSYVNLNFPGEKIIKWELENNIEQEVSLLTSQWELVFDLEGNYLRREMDDKDPLVPVGELPAAARSYLQTHFPNITVSRVREDRDGPKITYEVLLANTTYLEFNQLGAVLELENRAGLPVNVISERINAYVNQHYTGQKIIKWELDDRKQQEVTLQKDVELVFDLAGNFIRGDR
ncbi:MAG TPA: PepSY-like domain-containing protein [Pseudosphingobacterium sp.]|nr:PepSY-like domain-containing protein [Pseudosphingobacterium sp.]